MIGSILVGVGSEQPYAPPRLLIPASNVRLRVEPFQSANRPSGIPKRQRFAMEFKTPTPIQGVHIEDASVSAYGFLLHFYPMSAPVRNNSVCRLRGPTITNEADIFLLAEEQF
ncbi:hypothetical protein [Pseudomonas syringae]|uniref:hypothetical protein n=1 Tax=Pseudomonas syringae TaxID=317 RepID=UPI000F00484D|nr:hypothetical protein [Pseudomonas azotoformans]